MQYLPVGYEVKEDKWRRDIKTEDENERLRRKFKTEGRRRKVEEWKMNIED